MTFLRLILIVFVSFHFVPANPFTSRFFKTTENAGRSGFPDLYYEIHIAELNTQTSLNLYYDLKVQYYIDLYLTQRKDQLRNVIRLSDQYFPIFEHQLKIQGIPEEIKYLPVIESGLSPSACSPSSAVGLWQFKEKTGRYYGLHIGEGYDERKDPELSTVAACRYLKDLYKEFFDWNLALLAYNAGPVAVRSAVKMAGPNASLHDVLTFLPEPAQNYLPALFAVIYLFNDYNSHF